MSNTVTVPGLGNSLPIIYPSPEILTLFDQYDHPFPALGNQTFEVIQLNPTLVSLTIDDKLDFFLNNVVKRWSGLTQQPLAVSNTTLVTGMNVQPNIYNFYAITGNHLSSLLNPDESNAIGFLLNGVVQTYNVQALQYLTAILNTHELDVGDNPHHDTEPYLALQDTLIQFYTQYNIMFPGVLTQAQFNTIKGVAITSASLNSFENDTTAQAKVDLIPVIVFNEGFDVHRNGTDVTMIHADGLGGLFIADDKMPIPMINITPELGWFYFTQSLNPSAGFHYDPWSLYDELPRNNGTMLIQATLGSTPITTVNFLQLSCSTTADLFTLSEIPGVGVKLHINVGTGIWNQLLKNLSGNITLLFTWSSTGFTISYVDNTGTMQNSSFSFHAFYMNFDEIQIGVPLQRENLGVSIDALQCLRVYSETLDSTQTLLLLQPTTI